ncbi:cytochrome c biogenesis protein ResB [Thermodesulfobacteriota bacterium]
MTKEATAADFFESVWKFFSSIRLTIAILSSLAATSIIGTLIPQNENPAAYIREFGEFLYTLFNILDIFDIYHSWWFQFLLLLLALNITVCSIERLSAVWKIVFVKNPSFKISQFRNQKSKQEFTLERSPKDLEDIFTPILRKGFRYTTVESTQDGFHIFSEKGRWTRLGVYAVHLSVILLLIGGLIGSIFGFEGFVNIPEGEATDTISLRKNDQRHQLDFEIRCDDFNVSFYDSRAQMPKEFRSSLSILKNGKPVLQKDIIVNDPLRYKGINIFQSSYGKMPSDKPPDTAVVPQQATLKIVSRETGMSYQKDAHVGQAVELAEGMGTFRIKEFTHAATFGGQNIGKAFIGILTSKDGNSIEVLLPIHFPNFDRMRRGDQIISVIDIKDARFQAAVESTTTYYTGLQVTNDPGVWIVYTGFIVMIIGIFIAFFTSHQRVCVEVLKKMGNSAVLVSGTANKNKIGMQSRVQKLSKKLEGIAQKN